MQMNRLKWTVIYVGQAGDLLTQKMWFLTISQVFQILQISQISEKNKLSALKVSRMNWKQKSWTIMKDDRSAKT